MLLIETPLEDAVCLCLLPGVAEALEMLITGDLLITATVGDGQTGAVGMLLA